MAEKTPTNPRPKPLWRSWEHMEGEDLVEMPRALALDLVKAVNIASFLHSSSDEDCEAGLHESRFQAHRNRMERIMDTLTIHLTHEVEAITPDLLLRALVMSYETAPEIVGAGA